MPSSGSPEAMAAFRPTHRIFFADRHADAELRPEGFYYRDTWTGAVIYSRWSFVDGRLAWSGDVDHEYCVGVKVVPMPDTLRGMTTPLLDDLTAVLTRIEEIHETPTLAARRMAPALVRMLKPTHIEFIAQLNHLLTAHTEPYTGPTLEEIKLLGDHPLLDQKLDAIGVVVSLREILNDCATLEGSERAAARQALAELVFRLPPEYAEALTEAIEKIDPERRMEIFQWISLVATPM